MKRAGQRGQWKTSGGFTLLELMVVVFIIAIIMGMSIPNLSAKIRRDPLSQAVYDFVEACRNAREISILSGRTMEVRITPESESTLLQVQPAPVRDAGRFMGQSLQPGPKPDEGAGTPSPAKTTEPYSARFDNTVAFDDQTLRVNLRPVDRTESSIAIRFHSNGTCDQFEGIIHHNTLGDRKVTLEVTTGWPEVVTLR